jgi:hypothetical protein
VLQTPVTRGDLCLVTAQDNARIAEPEFELWSLILNNDKPRRLIDANPVIVYAAEALVQMVHHQNLMAAHKRCKILHFGATFRRQAC